MKTILGYSIFLNAAVLGTLLFMVTEGRRAAPVQMERAIPQAMPQAVPAKVAPPPLRWAQFDSPDYHMYVRNLRAAGCPEVSVRAIVTADADAVFGKRQFELEQDLSRVSHNSSSDQLTLRAELQHLPEAEAALIADLLGLPKIWVDVATAPKPVLQPPLNAANEPAALPLAFLDFDPAALNLNGDQMQTIASLRQNFLDQLGRPSQDSHDPVYLARWQHAQLDLDTMLQGMLGSEVFIKFQMLQLMDEHPAVQPPPPN